MFALGRSASARNMRACAWSWDLTYPLVNRGLS